MKELLEINEQWYCFNILHGKKIITYGNGYGF